ncbi:MAG: PA14 domain-containing protein [Polyangiaceae bacterium]
MTTVARSMALGLVALFGIGCTITSYKDPVPPPPPGALPTAGSQPNQGGTATNPGRRPAGRPTRPIGGAGGSATKVTTTTPFGGPAAAAFRGLAYVIPADTAKMPDFASLVPFAQLHTDRFDVASQPFQTGFPGALDGQVENFAIRYTGKFQVPAEGSYTFKLVSDDGAVVFVDGTKVVDNDGLHTVKTVTGEARLKAGSHDLRLDYFQAKGPVALQLFLVTSGRDELLTGAR